MWGANDGLAGGKLGRVIFKETVGVRDDCRVHTPLSLCFSRIFQGFFKDFSRFPKVSQGFPRFSKVFQSFSRFFKAFKVFQGFPRFSKVFQGFSRFFKVFLGYFTEELFLMIKNTKFTHDNSP